MRIELWPEGAPYAQGKEREDCPAITPYLVEGEGGKTPAVVVLPGGGYGMRADHEGEPIARWLNTLGVSAFVLDYRVAPYQHPTPLADAQRAMRYVRFKADEYKLDPARLGILGFSAGGHLAATASTHYDSGNQKAADPVERLGCRPDFSVLCYPVITMGEYTHSGSRTNLLGENPSVGDIQLMSNELQVTSDTPPAFLWHTSDDPAVPVENVLLYAGALSKNKVPFELHSFVSGQHGLGLATEHPEAYAWTALCARWLKRLGCAPHA